MLFAPTFTNFLQIPTLPFLKAPLNAGSFSYHNHGSEQYVLQGDKSPFTSEFEALVKEKLDYFKTPGLAVSVLHGDNTYMKGYGTAQYPDVPVSPETLFYAASTTKAFTAAAVTLLVDDDTNHPEVQWTTPIQSLIPEDFQVQDEYATSHITLEDAACHRTGLATSGFSLPGDNKTTSQTVVRSMRHLPMTRPFRTEFQYSNQMYTTLGYVVEKLTNMSLGQFFRKRIWKPLGMNSTYFRREDAIKDGKKIAQGYHWDEKLKKHQPLPALDMSALAGASFIMSNVKDYSKWVRAMMEHTGPISPAGHAALVSPHMVDSPGSAQLSAYGLGWFIMNYHGAKIVTHTGGIPGFESLVLYLPEQRWGTVLFSNGVDASVLEALLAFHLIDNLFEVPQGKRANYTQLYEDMQKQRQILRNVPLIRSLLYPQPGNISHSLPLPEYTGSYTHPAFGKIAVKLQQSNESSCDLDGLGPASEKGNLIADLHRLGLINATLTLDHVSSDIFFAYGSFSFSPENIIYSEAEFKIDVTGKVTQFGILLETSMAPEKIWFDRISS